MPILQDILDSAQATARQQKEHATAHTIDLYPTLICLRGAEPVAIVVSAMGGRDVMQVAGVCAKGYQPDVLALVVDTYVVEGRKGDESRHPITGQAWKQGDFQDLAENHDGLARGWVTESLGVMAANRAGDVHSAFLPYRVDGRVVTWKGPSGEVAEVSGFMVETLRRLMLAPGLDVAMAAMGVTPQMAGMTADEARVHADVAVTRTLQEHGMAAVMMPAEPGSYRAEVVQRAFPDAQVIGG